jgi:hypothetical protein
MMERALAQRWPIKPEYRELIVKRMLRIIADPKSSPREVTSATKALLAAESQNQADEHKLVDVAVIRNHDELSAIASELGVSFNLPAATTGQAGSSSTTVEAG